MDKETHFTRDRGILTPADRKFLLGETELDGDSARQARQRIRDRLKDAILDFNVLRFGLEERDRRLLGNDLFGNGRSALWHGYVDMFGFFYILNNDFGHSLHPDIRYAIQDVEDQFQHDRGQTVDVKVNLEVTKEVVHDHSELKEKYDEGEALTPDEMQTLLFDSVEFDHLLNEEKWEMFGEFLSGDLDVECRIEPNDDIKVA